MKRLIESIKKSLEQDNYYSAFFIALALPDICGKITFDGRSKERYTKWCDAFFVDKYTIDMNGVKIYPYKGILTSLDIYALRCSMLHEGKDYVGGQPAHKMIEKFLFCVSQKNYIHCNMTKGKLNFDIIHFCNDMCNFVTSWLIDYPTKLEIDIVHEIFCL